MITGFRVACGGAQERWRVAPDLTILGKIIGGGLPVAAYGGRRDLMEMVAPLGPVYQAGTLSGNPLAMRAGLASLAKIAANPGLYNDLDTKAGRLETSLKSALSAAGVVGQVNRIGSLLTLFFSAGPVVDYATAKKSDTSAFGRFFQEMLKRGILLPPSQFEALFISSAHTEADISRTIEAANESLKAVSNGS